MRLAAITGATGFVGRHVVNAFLKAGWRLRLLSRSYPRFESQGLPVEVIPANLSDEKAFLALAQDADVIIHLAGVVKARDKAGFMNINTGATRAIAHAWRSVQPSAKFILLSSLAAREATLSHYARSKAEGEKAVRASGANYCILRPCAIYGPGDRELLGAFKAASLPFQPMLNTAEARVAMVHVRDVAQAVLAVAENPEIRGEFELCDARIEGYQWGEIIDAVCAACGKTARPFFVPPVLLKAIARGMELRAALTGLPVMLTRHKVREILHHNWGSTHQAQLPAHIWQPRHPLMQGLHETGLWYRQMGWIG